MRNYILDRFTFRSLLLNFDVNKTSSERQTPITLQTKQESNLLSFPWTRSKNRSWIFGDESAQREKPDLRKLWFVKWDVGVLELAWQQEYGHNGNLSIFSKFIFSFRHKYSIRIREISIDRFVDALVILLRHISNTYRLPYIC